MDMDDISKKYQKGLKELLGLVIANPDIREKVERLQAQLIENIDSVQTFGDKDNLKSERQPLLEELNRLAYESVGHSFNKICALTEVDINDYRTNFREKVFNLYKYLGFEINREFTNPEIRADFVINYKMPLKKAYASLVKTVVSVEDLINEEFIVRFQETLNLARQEGIAITGEVVTDIGFTSEAYNYAQKNNIQLLTYSECLNTIIDFNRYLDQFIYDYEHHEDFKKGLRQSVFDIIENCDLAKEYISPRVANIDGQIFNSCDEYIDTWLKDEAKNVLVILGEPGYGKTSLILHSAYQLALRYKQDPEKNRIPVIVSFKDNGTVINSQQMITNLLINKLNLLFSNYAAFEMLLQNRKLVLLFDGWDEVLVDNDPNRAAENFLELNKLMADGGKMIITSDTRHLLRQRHARHIFSEREDLTSGMYSKKFEPLFLQDFDPKQISDFLKARTQNWQAFYIKIKSIPELETLSRHPFVLEMMWRTLVRVIREKKPFNPSSFYDIYTMTWIEQDDDDSIMMAEERMLFVEEIALEMLRKGRLYLHNSELPNKIRERFIDYLRDYKEAEVFAYDVGTCPFLMEDLEGNYKFKHKSLVDFFIAKKYINCLLNQDLTDFNDIILPIEVKHFIVELLPKKYNDPDELRKNMVKIPSGKASRPFLLDKYPVKNQDYFEFIQNTKFEPPKHWKNGMIPDGKEQHPVTNISWYEAELFAKWAGKRLPTENEWEKASGFEDGLEYAWGNEFNKEKCNSIESGRFDTVPISSFPENVSPCGCSDMTGNVWEWTCSWVEEKRKDKGYVAKGGSFLSDAENLSSKNRLNYSELKVNILEAVGFRCAS